MDRKVIILAVLLVLAASDVLPAPPETGEPAPVGLQAQPVRIVDFPTAGLLPRRGFRIETDIYADGGLLLSLSVGFARYFSFGISYGGYNVIGSDDPVMNPEPAVNLKARLIEESVLTPAIAIGFDSQGYGEFLDDKEKYGEERYLVKSRGVFAVASKNWELLGALSLHGGLSYSLENTADNDLTVFAGLIKSFGGFLDLRAEYDVATNDNEGKWEIVEDRGYLNASVVWHLNENFALSLEVRDVSAKDGLSQDGVEDLRKWNRGLSIVYYGFL
ncbi:MAG: hypothetical protein ABIJ00_06405 [Candidatus Eisenbacteria bacterium]